MIEIFTGRMVVAKLLKGWPFFKIMPDIPNRARFLEKIVRKIAFPRYSGTKEVERAEKLLLEECADLRIEPEIQTFQTSNFFMHHVNTLPYFLLGILMVLTSLAILLEIAPIVLVFLALLLFALGLTIEGIIRKIKHPSMNSRFAEKYPSKNMILSDSFKTTQKLNIFVLAHIDSKSESPSPHVLFTIIYLSVQVGTILFSVHLLVFAISLYFLDLLLHSPLVFVYGFLLGGIDMLRILTRYFPGESLGANDDAIGCAIALLLQHHFNSNPLNHVNIVGVLTGSEEIGEAGAYHFLKTNQKYLDKENSHFLVLDGLTGKKIYTFTSFGFRRRAFSSVFQEALEELETQDVPVLEKIELIKMWMPPPVNTDHSAVVHFDYPAFVFASPENVSHSAQDIPEKINYSELEGFVDFLIALFAQIDNQSIKKEVMGK